MCQKIYCFVECGEFMELKKIEQRGKGELPQAVEEVRYILLP